jgi:hypothetical protein
VRFHFREDIGAGNFSLSQEFIGDFLRGFLRINRDEDDNALSVHPVPPYLKYHPDESRDPDINEVDSAFAGMTSKDLVLSLSYC